jgi:hypothetical protein
MKKLLALLLVGVVYADNEVYVDQVGATFNLDIEQLGSSNIIGGLNSVAGFNDCVRLRRWNYDLGYQPDRGYQ